MLTDEATAKRMANVLMAGYRRQDIVDPDAYATIVVMTLTQYPPKVGWQAIKRVTAQQRHPPTRADLCEAIEEILKPERDKQRAWEVHQATMAAIDEENARMTPEGRDLMDRLHRRDLRGPGGEMPTSTPLITDRRKIEAAERSKLRPLGDIASELAKRPVIKREG